MDKDPLIVIDFSEDGIYITNLTRKKFLTQLDEEFWGDNIRFLDKIPDNTNDFGAIRYPRSLLVIDGRVIVPKPETVVQKWKL